MDPLNINNGLGMQQIRYLTTYLRTLHSSNASLLTTWLYEYDVETVQQSSKGLSINEMNNDDKQKKNQPRLIKSV